MPRTHELKTLSPFWDAIESGEKTFEIRENDRGFQKGDLLVLKRYKPGEVYARPPELKRQITYVLSGWGLKNGYVALGLGPLGPGGKE